MMTTTCLIGVLIAYVFCVFGVLLVPPAHAAVTSAAALRHASAICMPTRRDATRVLRIGERCASIAQTLLGACIGHFPSAMADSAHTPFSCNALAHAHSLS